MSTSTRRGSNGVSMDYKISLDCILVNRTLRSLHKDKNMVGHVGKQRMKGL